MADTGWQILKAPERFGRMEKHMTIKEIAQLAGVSSAAVSRYLNGGYVSDEKKEQIRRVIEETGYQPSAQARILRTKKACLVGVVVPKINSESISRVTAGIEQVLSRRGYQMLLGSTDNDPVKEISYLKLFENYPVDGIILIGTVITAEHRRFLKNSKVPVVVVGQYTKYANCIYHDDYGAGKAMGKAVAATLKNWRAEADEACTEVGECEKELHVCGKVAYIGVTKEDKAVGVAREDGFRAGLRSEGIELEETCTRKAEFTMESGYKAALDLLEEHSDIRILSCATDTIAAGAIEALLTYSRRKVPEKAKHSGGRMLYILDNSGIRVTGFGDNQFLKAVTGGIPTVHFGYKTSGIRGAELLLDVIERGEKIPVEMKLGFRMVNEEDSTQDSE